MNGKPQMSTLTRERRRTTTLTTALALAGAIVAAPVPADHRPTHTPDWTDFNVHDPGITLLTLDSAVQALMLLVANPAPAGVVAPPCRFSGAVVAEDRTPPAFGSGLGQFVFEPLDLGPGEAMAVHVAPEEDTFGAGAIHARVLEVAIVPDRPGRGPCGVIVEMLGYDRGSEATEVHVDRYVLGVERTFHDPVGAGADLPLGFAGGNAAQHVRVILAQGFKISENQSPFPKAACSLSGELVARTVPVAGEDALAALSLEQAWPLKWQGPPDQAVAVVEVPLADLGASSVRRVDALFSLRLKGRPPAACLMQLQGTLQIVDADGRARTAVPRDRLFFGYNHFNHTLLH